jgi:hypothetical protein
MTGKSRLQSMAPLIEFLASGGLALFFHFGLNNHDAAYMIFGFGILLSLATFILREESNHLREGLAEEYRRSHWIAFHLSRIRDPDCQGKARALLDGLRKEFTLLEQGHIPLNETELLMEATRNMDQALGNVKAVNPLIPGWSTRSPLVRYYDSNRRAVLRGVGVTRIFVIHREQLEEAEVQQLMLNHLNDGIVVRIVFRDELPSGGEGGWAAETSFNFAIFDDRFVLDIRKAQGPHYGTVTRAPPEIVKYRRLFDLTEHHSHKAIRQEGRVVAVL